MFKLIATAALMAAQAQGTVAGGAPGQVQQAESPTAAEARAFMDAYAVELKAGDRAAIAARYSRRGAYAQGFGGDRFQTHAQIVASYAGPEWSPPRDFAWQGLRYDPVGADAVLVTGRFVWTPASGSPLTVSYTALLVREEGGLRIRLEHESGVPRPR